MGRSSASKLCLAMLAIASTIGASAAVAAAPVFGEPPLRPLTGWSCQRGWSVPASANLFTLEWSCKSATA
jgi:hypothetical protein